MRGDILEKLQRVFNERAPIAVNFGMRLAYNEDGQAVVRLPHNPDLNQALGGVHGGVMATILDSAGWFTAAAAYGRASWLATSQLSIHFLEPVREEELVAVGKVIKLGKRQAVVEMTLHTQAGVLVAHAVGTFIPLPEIPLLD